MLTLFISDLHLSPSQSKLNKLFVDFLSQYAIQAKALYILGDLFESWIGADHHPTFNQGIALALRRLVSSGVQGYLMPGNRDFLISPNFIRVSGCQLLADPSVIDLYNQPTLLTHGDSLCTLDKAYLRFRRWACKPHWQALFLRLPLRWRQQIARFLRQQSAQTSTVIIRPEYDAVTQTVQAWMQHYQTPLLIHGHTHQPAIHCFRSTGHWFKRVVLSDWQQQAHAFVYYASGDNQLRYFSEPAHQTGLLV